MHSFIENCTDIISILHCDRLSKNSHKFINKINGKGIGLFVSRPQINSEGYSFSIFINFIS